MIVVDHYKFDHIEPSSTNIMQLGILDKEINRTSGKIYAVFDLSNSLFSIPSEVRIG